MPQAHFRYNYFLKPGNTLHCNVKVISIGDDVAKFSGEGYINDRLAVSAKLELACMNQNGKVPCGEKIDERLVEVLKKEFEFQKPSLVFPSETLLTVIQANRAKAAPFCDS